MNMRRSLSILLIIAAVLALGTFIFVRFVVPKMMEDITINREYEDLGYLAKSVEEYRLATGAIPTTSAGLNALVERPDPSPAKWRRILDAIPRDVWNRPLQYRVLFRDGGRVPEIFSCGSDRVAGTKDDLSSLDPACQRWIKGR